MILKSLAVAAAISLFSTAAITQSEVARSRFDGRGVQFPADIHASAAVVGRGWIASGYRPQPTTVSPCEITAGRILTPRLDVANPPAAPKIETTFRNCTPGVKNIYARFQSSRSVQYMDTYYAANDSDPPRVAGTVQFARIGLAYPVGAFTPYSQPGVWALSQLSISDRQGNARDYQGAALASLFPSLGIRLTNAGTADSMAPLITAGQLLTPTVRLSSAWPAFGAKLTVSDDVSGVAYTFVTVCVPGSLYNCLGYSEDSPAPFLNGNVKDYDYLCSIFTGDCSGVPTGTWTITGYGACDVAGNCLYDYNTSDVMALFGTTTFSVTH